MTQHDMISFFLGEASSCVSDKRYTQAFNLLAKGFLLAPEHASSFLPLATICQLLRRWDDLQRFAHIRLQHCPDDTGALYHLAGAALSQRRFSEGLVLLEKVIAKDRHHLNAWIDLGCTQKKMGDILQAIHCFRQAVDLDPSSAIAYDNLLFALLFSDDCSPDEQFDAHRAWGMQHGKAIVASPLLPLREGKMRIGYLSPDLREHSVTAFLEPLLAHHDHSRFEIFCYHSHTDEDAVTGRLKTYTDKWCNISGVDDNGAAELIRGDGIQILVELAGHTAWNRLSLLNLRPAPIQVSWLGYPHSTGMTAIDYRITDAISDPPGISERLHTEQLLRLPETFLCFRPLEAVKPLRLLPCQRNGYITFGSFNNFAKASPAIVSCWQKIMALLPDARLLLKSEIFADRQACQMIAERLGFSDDRLMLIGTTPDRTAHLALYGQIDIALDTFPYNGTTTTCEALSMGVPVITLSGGHHVSRVGRSLLQTVGVGDLVAQTAGEYIEKACVLSRDVPRLAWLREQLPGLISNSPLMDPQRFTTAMESAFEQIWQLLVDVGSRPAR